MGLDILMGSERVLDSLCSRGGDCEMLLAFWVELRRVNMSPGLQRLEAGKGCC
jgi:hypothetical protein